MNEVAKRAGLSHSMVSRMEHELRKPTLDTLLRISGAIGVEIWPFIQKAEGTMPIVKQKIAAKGK